MSHAHADAVRAAPRATGLTFLISGALLAAWAPLVPLAKARLQLDEAGLGAVLLCMGLGALASMPFAGTLARRWGYRRLLGRSLWASVLLFPGLAWFDATWAVALTLFLFGMTMGSQDVVMNLLAVEVEKANARPLMSGFHGRWSVGTIIGAGLASSALSLGLDGRQASLAVALAGVLGTLYLISRLPDVQPAERDRHPLFVWPKGSVLLIGLLALLLYLVEHSVLDWSAVYLVSALKADPQKAGWAFTLFAGAMTLCRLTGDRIRGALGDRRVLLFGGLLTAAGLLTVTLSGSVPVALAGYVAVGVGAANIVPVLFSVAGNTRDMSPTLALTAVASMGYFGALGGPAVIGFMAKAWGLPVAFAVLAASMLAVAASHRLAPPAKAAAGAPA